MDDGGVNERDDRRRGGGFRGCLAAILVLVLLIAGAGAAVWYLGDSIRSRFMGPDPVSVECSLARAAKSAPPSSSAFSFSASSSVATRICAALNSVCGAAAAKRAS